jgi:hypothetical protein
MWVCYATQTVNLSNASCFFKSFLLNPLNLCDFANVTGSRILFVCLESTALGGDGGSPEAAAAVGGGGDPGRFILTGGSLTDFRKSTVEVGNPPHFLKVFFSVADPDPSDSDPNDFGPPGFGSFYHQGKNSKKKA